MKFLDIQDTHVTERELTALAQATGDWADPTIRAHIRLAVRRRNRDRIKFWYRTLLRRLETQPGRFHPFLPDPKQTDIAPGQLVLGRLATSGWHVTVPLNMLLLQAFVTGPPGCGKSYYIRHVVSQVISAGVSVLIFDTQSEYGDLARLFGPETLDLMLYTDCRLSPFDEPKTMQHREWVLGPMMNYFRESLWWRDRTSELMRSICIHLFDAGNTRITPQLFLQSYDKVPAYKKNLPEAGSLQRFVTMLRSVATFQCSRGEAIEDIASRSRVLDLREAPNDLRRFLISDIATKLLLSRSYSDRNDLATVLVFDETSQFFSREALARSSDIAESFYFLLLRTGRKYSVSSILSDQVYASVHPVARADCQLKVAFELRDAPSRYQIARDLGLDRDQESFLAELSYRAGRRALVQIPSYPFPFLIDVPHFDKPSALTDEELAERRAMAVAAMQWEPIRAVLPDVTVRSLSDLDEKHLKILAVAACHPFRSQQEHARALRIAVATFSRYASKLVDAGFVTKETIATYRRGGNLNVIIPTDRGYTYLDARRVSYAPLSGNGSLQHKFCQHRIWESVRRTGDYGGVEYEIEGTGKRVDVGVIRPQKEGGVERIAYEVVMTGTLAKEISNLRKDLAAGWDRVIFCVENDDVRDRLAALVNRELSDSDDRAEIRLLGEFVGQAPSNAPRNRSSPRRRR